MKFGNANDKLSESSNENTADLLNSDKRDAISLSKSSSGESLKDNFLSASQSNFNTTHRQDNLMASEM